MTKLEELKMACDAYYDELKKTQGAQNGTSNL